MEENTPIQPSTTTERNAGSIGEPARPSSVGTPPPLHHPSVYASPVPQPPPAQPTTPPPANRGSGILAFCCGSCAGCLFSLLLLILCVVLFFVGMSKMVSGLSDSISGKPGVGASMNEHVVEEGFGEGRVAVIDIHGIIVGSSNSLFGGDGLVAANRLIALLKEVRKDESVAAIILDMNTPGGEVVASDEIRQEIDAIVSSGLPVVTMMRAMGASGGYYIASGSSWIVANPVCLTGSVGVIMSGVEYHGLMDKLGVKPMVYRSGKLKDIGSGMREPTDEETAYMQGLIDETFGRFCEVVSKGRPKHFPTADDVRKAEFGDGRPVSGQAALDYHLIDQLGGMNEAIAKARSLCGHENAEVFRATRASSDFLEALFSSRSNTTLRVEGLPAAATTLKPGVMYYIMPEAI